LPEPAAVAGPTDGVLLVDKPPGVTSTRALAAAKCALGLRKAGHTGTLDPFATGLLPIVFGEGTKFSRFLLDADKSYRALLRLGFTSTTADTEGEITQAGAISPTMEAVGSVLSGLRGAQEQVPPMHSAVRIDGRRLYDLARQGVEIARDARWIEVYELEVVSFSGEMLEISVKCSKGTYVRTLGEEIGRRLGCGAYLTQLRRTAIGDFRVEDSATPEALAALGEVAARARLLPPEALVAQLPRLDLDEGGAWAICNGQEWPLGAPVAEGEFALFASGSRFLGVGRVRGGRLSAARLMHTGHG
jgi:tRNA pseudouridine55 synthase